MVPPSLDNAYGPLAGIKILDFTTMMSGPLGTRLLADMGADVVKVESPTGDHNRSRTPIAGGMSRYFAQLNAGKRSIMLDLKEPRDREVAEALSREADVVIENNRPGVMDRLGFGYHQLAREHPAIVYCSISGFGQNGPGTSAAAYAPNIHASSGYDMANMVYQEAGCRQRPANTAIFIADALAAVYACAAIEGALLARARTGQGQYIDLALFETMLNVMVFEMQIAQTDQPPIRSIYGPMPTGDGFVSVAAVSQKQFRSLMSVIGHPDWADDPRWAQIEAREANWSTLMEAVEAWTVTLLTADCLKLLTEAGVAASRYRTPAEVLTDEQLAHRGTFVQQRDLGGNYLLIKPPFQFADGSVHARGHVPRLDEDHESVIRDWLDDEA
jgi:CoA:oxalate CoA-transferase